MFMTLIIQDHIAPYKYGLALGAECKPNYSQIDFYDQTKVTIL